MRSLITWALYCFWLPATCCLPGSAIEPRMAELPRLFPDYVGVTLPPNIAPLNFRILEPAASYRVELRSTTGTPLVLSSPGPAIRIPPKAWASLLRANPGQPMYWDISARAASSGWTRFATVTNYIAREEIDGWLAYRLLKPIFNFDIRTGRWGQPEVMIAAADIGLSVCEPKISLDGRWLLVTLCQYGNFPIHQPSSELYVMDLATRKLRRLEINSDRADTWHSWSSNSRWVVFSSKRIDGLFARPHFSYVDEQGEFHKPFVLPQEDPAFYGFCLNTFNVPELMQGPVTVTERELARAITNPRKVLTPQGPPGPPSPATQPGQDQSTYPPTRE